jgi:cytochrome c-type biogenesis protein CcmH/NrfF
VTVAVVAVAAVLWSFALFHAPSDSGSLDARVTAVGATVRCPICPEPIPLNDVQNPQALQMRQFISHKLQLGESEDEVRQDLVRLYGPGILLAPPQRGFDLLIWVVPLVAVVACALAVLRTVQRWTGDGGDRFTPAAPSESASSAEAPSAALQRYEEMLDRELAARE